MRPSILILAAATIINFAVSQAHAYTFHYACQDHDDHYSVVIDTKKLTVKMTEQSPEGRTISLKILDGGTGDNAPAACGRGGWSLSYGATFCYATQGYGELSWKGVSSTCQQAD